jgi:hypothetical protein
MLFLPIYDKYIRFRVLLFVSFSLFCPSFWCVSMAFEVHQTSGPQ